MLKRNGWTDEDFRAVYTFLGTMQELLKDKTCDLNAVRDVLLSDLAFAKEAFDQIADGVLATR